MKLDPMLALAYQRSLIYLSLEDCSATFLLAEYAGGLSGANLEKWKATTIEFLIRNLNGKLISTSVMPSSVEAFDDQELCDLFFKTDPNENVEIWFGIQFAGTEKLRCLVQANDLFGWDKFHGDLNENFIKTISSIYDGT
jgi:hypothetical protein